MEQVSKVPLQELSTFASSFSASVLEELLATSSMKPEERTAFREQYRNMQVTLESVQKEYRRYEEIERPIIKECLEAYLLFLQKGPESREELIQQFAVVLDQAARIDVLDDGMMDLLKDIWPEVLWPEQLPAFEGGQLPLQRRLPKFGFTSLHANENAEIQLRDLNKVKVARIDLAELQKANLVTSSIKRAKVILAGKIDKAITLVGIKATAGARKAIEEAGGKIEE